MVSLDILFERWLDGQPLAETELALLHQDEQYAAMMHEANVWQAHAQSYRNEPVPTWDRESTYAHSMEERSAWWPQAIAASISVITLLASVMLWHQNTQLKEQLLTQQQQGIQNQQQLATLFEQFDGLQRQQSAQLLDAVQHVLTTSRDERREDMSVLLEYWKTQRAQDNALFKIQLNDIAEQVEHLPPNKVAKLEEY